MRMIKALKRLAVFALSVIIVQYIAVLFLTPSGVENIYPFAVRLSAERIKPESNTYAVYYGMRRDVSDADVIVVGIDENVGMSYSLLGHFTRFLKQYGNISTVILDLTPEQTSLVISLLEQTEEESYNEIMELLRGSEGMGEEYCEYISELFYINSTVPSTQKFSVISYGDQLGEVAGSVLYIADSRELYEIEPIQKTFEENFPNKDILFVNTYYTKSCESPETHSVYEFVLERGEESAYYVNTADMKSYNNYKSFVLGSDKAEKLNEGYTDHYFVITGEIGNTAED